MTDALAVRKDPVTIFASLIASLTHPVILGTLGLLTIVLKTIDKPSEQLLYLLLLILITFLPAALYLLVHFKGSLVQMLELIDREARLIPYILMIAGAVTAVIILVSLQAPRPIFVMTLVLLANEIVMATINFWTKVSIHTATTTFTALTLGYLIDPAWYGLLALVPLIAWARLQQKRHTASQVIGGTVVSAVISGIVIILSHIYL